MHRRVCRTRGTAVSTACTAATGCCFAPLRLPPLRLPPLRLSPRCACCLAAPVALLRLWYRCIDCLHRSDRILFCAVLYTTARLCPSPPQRSGWRKGETRAEVLHRRDSRSFSGRKGEKQRFFRQPSSRPESAAGGYEKNNELTGRFIFPRVPKNGARILSFCELTSSLWRRDNISRNDSGSGQVSRPTFLGR